MGSGSHPQYGWECLDAKAGRNTHTHTHTHTHWNSSQSKFWNSWLQHAWKSPNPGRHRYRWDTWPVLARMPFSVSFTSINDRKSLGHGPVDQTKRKVLPKIGSVLSNRNRGFCPQSYYESNSQGIIIVFNFVSEGILRISPSIRNLPSGVTKLCRTFFWQPDFCRPS